jgi:DNA-binding transcriptional MocR family regulator
VDLSIDKSSKTPLYAQIRDAIEHEIKQGSLKPGERLPTVSALAKEIGVTQATIRRAFEDLSKDGLIISHVGRGTFIGDPTPSGKEKGGKRSSFGRSLHEHAGPEFYLAARRLRMGISKSLDSLMELARRPGLISFTSGIPDPELMEEGILEKLVHDALKAGQSTYQVYGGVPAGMEELRVELAKRFSKNGIQVSPEQILITSGSQQAISILAQSALEKKQRVVCETPCFMGIPNALGALGHWVESVPRDREGPIPERLNRFSDGVPSVFYLCSELHNPMGTDISPERKTQLVEWAGAHMVDLISDEIFRDLRFEGPAPISLLSEVGHEGHVVIGSLSKSFMVGLRIGWLITNPEKIRTLITLKRAMDLGCPPLMQGIALSLLRSGEYDSHLERAREHYRLRRDAAIEALERCMPAGVTWTVPQGGFHLWVELPPGYSSIVLFLHAIERGVSFWPGPMQDVDHRYINGFRFSYGSVTPEQIQEGVELLADGVRELLKGPPGEHGLGGLGDFL